MTYITKPPVRHPALQKNDIGLTRRDLTGYPAQADRVLLVTSCE